MIELVVLTLLLVAVVLAIGFLSTRRARRRHRLLGEPLPDSWVAALEKDFPRFRSIPRDIRQRLGGIARILAEEKNFEACGGLDEVTEEMKALICAQAALLIVALPKHGYFPRLMSILVYPGAFRDRGERRFSLREEERGTLLGESWESGSVILSWDNVLFGARNADDGMNVVIHEFAHQLDQVNGAGDGVPILRSREAYRLWAEVFERSYEELVDEVENRKGRDPLIDPYGATDPAEFFAVASETFFEESRELRDEHPDLYGQLSAYFGLDPAEWTEAA